MINDDIGTSTGVDECGSAWLCGRVDFIAGDVQVGGAVGFDGAGSAQDKFIVLDADVLMDFRVWHSVARVDVDDRFTALDETVFADLDLRGPGHVFQHIVFANAFRKRIFQSDRNLHGC